MKVSRSLIHPPQNGGPLNFCEIEDKPHFNGKFFQILQLSDMWFN